MKFFVILCLAVVALGADFEAPQTIPEDIIVDAVQPEVPEVIATTINWDHVLPVWNAPTFFDWFPILRRILTRDRDSEWNGYILGGSIAQPGQFPETVALLFHLPMAHAFCGGTLLSDKWVLTSAHCGGLSNTGIAILGAHEVQNNMEFGQVRMTFQNIVRHPHFNPTSFANDISLVELDHPVGFTWRVAPARLPTVRNANSNWFNQRTLVSGWGSRKDTISTQHRYIRAQVLPRLTCTVSYPGMFHQTSLCTPGNERSPCQGDSGAGLSIIEADGAKTTIGVLSFGSGLGCFSGRPAVYTNVAPYLMWIRDVANITIRENF
ncbi:collagenase-like [Lutzomyia longipalpis]|uniref:collagenase-like n=1 Tax=Lutzomyia longipalpis TaxID=7200 RepID=UPI0024833F8F|nr:collagenase-like [Lutzomyia longipalpis]